MRARMTTDQRIRSTTSAHTPLAPRVHAIRLSDYSVAIGGSIRDRQPIVGTAGQPIA